MTKKRNRLSHNAKPKKNTPESGKPELVEAPDWVNETPDDTNYSLMMYDQGGQGEQEIHMSRDEYIRLKRWLAALRGFCLASPLDGFTVHNLKNRPEGE